MYIGNQPAQSFATVTSQTINGDGGATYTLNRAVNNGEELEVFVNNVQQQPTVAYTASSTTLTFTENVPSATGNIYVIYRGLAQNVGQDENAPRLIGDNTFTGNQTITGAVDTSAKASINLASSGNAIDFKLGGTTIGNVGVISDRVYLTAEGSHGVYLDASANNFCPSSTTGTDADGTIDLGASFARWKDAYFSGGIHLGGTGSANEIEDYEEGAWTGSELVGGNMTVTVSDEQYVKVGRMVHFDCVVTFSGNDTDRVKITGLPFTSTNTSAVAIYYSQGPFDHLKMLVSGVTIFGANTNGDATYTSVNGMTARFSGTYMATA